jgi:Podovirus DNA encapsidation protein (Gp16).
MKSIYYKYNHIFSYNTKIIAVVGARGIGKTYGAKRYVIKKFLHEGRKFIWLRDTEIACDELRANDGAKFFADVKQEFNDKFCGSIKNDIITINGKHAGYLLPMSTYYNYKGNSYADIQTIVFDEFMAEKGQKRNGNRTLQFLNTIETIGRLRTDYRIILLANALDRGDEILNLFNIKIKDFGYYFNKQKSFVLHYADNNPDFNKARELSISGRLLKNTAYEENIASNKFADDDNQYFDKRPPKCKLFAILHNDYGSVRLYLHNGTVYACRDFN